MGGENPPDSLRCRQACGVRFVTLQLLACCCLNRGKWKITPLNSASNERTLISWFLSQLDTCETCNCKSVPVEEREESKGNQSDVANPKGRIFIINCLTLKRQQHLRNLWMGVGSAGAFYLFNSSIYCPASLQLT